MRRDAIFSIKPNMAEAIYAGRKIVELRTRVPVEEVRRIWLYESAPVKMITGSFRPGKIESPKTASELYDEYGIFHLIGEYPMSAPGGDEDLKEVIKVLGDRKWYQIEIIAPGRLIHPIDPRDPKQNDIDVREHWTAPQSWRYCNPKKSI